MTFIKSMFTLLTVLTKHIMTTWMQKKRKIRFKTSQLLTNTFAFDIENSPTSFKLGYTK